MPSCSAMARESCLGIKVWESRLGLESRAQPANSHSLQVEEESWICGASLVFVVHLSKQ